VNPNIKISSNPYLKSLQDSGVFLDDQANFINNKDIKKKHDMYLETNLSRSLSMAASLLPLTLPPLVAATNWAALTGTALGIHISVDLWIPRHLLVHSVGNIAGGGRSYATGARVRGL